MIISDIGFMISDGYGYKIFYEQLLRLGIYLIKGVMNFLQMAP